MNKNIIMVIGALVVVLVAIFWVQYNIVKSLQANSNSPLLQNTTANPTAGSSTTPAGTSTAPKAASKETVGKKTTITAPVHKH